MKRPRIRLDRSIVDRDIDVAYLIAMASILRGGSMDLIERLATGKFELVRSAVDEAVRIIEFETCLPAKRYAELSEDERRSFGAIVKSPGKRPFIFRGRLPDPESLEAFLSDARSDPTVARRVAQYALWIASKVLNE